MFVYSIRRTMILGLVLALALICLNMFWAYRVVERLIVQNQTLNSGYEMLDMTRVCLAVLQDVENSQREYLLTGSGLALDQYRQAIFDLNIHLSAIKSLVQSRRLREFLPLLAQEIQGLEQEIQKRVSISEQAVNFKQQGQLDEVQRHLNSGQGQKQMLKVRLLIRRLVAYQSSMLKAMRREASSNSPQVLLTMVVASLVNLTLLLLIYRMMARGLLHSQQAEARLRTSEAELRTSEARKSAILETALDCVISVEQNNLIIEWNPAAEQTFGYTRAEALGRPLPELFKAESLAGLSQQDLSHLPNLVLRQRLEVMALRRDGREFPAEIAVTRTESGGQTLWTVYVRDISERKQIELALYEARDAAEMANQTKSMFLANMSHELRTPLNVILGYAELLEEEVEDENRQEIVADLYKIRHAGHHLLTLINQVLDLAKIEAGKMQVYLEDFEIGGMVIEVADSVKLLMAQNHNQFQYYCPPDIGRMYSDVLKLRQALLNLLSNAAKFTQEGFVNLEVLREFGEQEDWILFCVTDTGVGIAPEQMSKLFEPFMQVDTSSTRQYEGTGLGLTLTRHFCALLGGEITVSSQPGQGSSFTMRIPARCAGPSQLTDSSHLQALAGS